MSPLSQNYPTQHTVQRLSLAYKVLHDPGSGFWIPPILTPATFPLAPSSLSLLFLIQPVTLLSCIPFVFFLHVAFISPNNDITGTLTSFRSLLKRLLITWFSLISLCERACPLHIFCSVALTLLYCFFHRIYQHMTYTLMYIYTHI